MTRLVRSRWSGAVALSLLMTSPPCAADEPRGPLALRDAVAAALLRHPALAADAWEVRVREARALQAGALPNPELTVEVENVGGEGERADFEQTETTLWLSQLVELGGKRGKRRAVEERRTEAAQWSWEARRLEVLTATAKAFAAALAEQARLDLAADLERLSGSSMRDVRRRLGAGAVSPVDLAQVEVLHVGAGLERRRAERALATAHRALAAMWGQQSVRFTTLRGDLTDGVTEPPDLPVLTARLGDNPDLARWGSELAEREAVLALERARRIPDPTLGVGGRHFSDNGDDALVFQFSVPLPVFDRNGGNVLAAERDLARAQAERADAERSARAALAGRWADLEAAHEDAATLRTRGIPSAERALASVQEGHRRGRLAGHEVLDAQRTLFQLRLETVEALLAYHHARADVERLIAGPVTGEQP